ncbi:cyclase family protein [Streptomyces cellulosae]|uniref:Cyclase family protein n=1 Tax=Streptomyces cellulosae TaxID=1968 RepID=A0ABW7YGH7_STRCE
MADAAWAAQNTELRPGDILMIRTGWARYHLRELTPDEQRRGTAPRRAPGLKTDHETVESLWDHHFSVVATDNFSVKAWPASPDSPFVTDTERRGDIARTGHTGLMHRVDSVVSSPSS